MVNVANEVETEVCVRDGLISVFYPPKRREEV